MFYYAYRLKGHRKLWINYGRPEQTTFDLGTGNEVKARVYMRESTVRIGGSMRRSWGESLGLMDRDE